MKKILFALSLVFACGVNAIFITNNFKASGSGIPFSVTNVVQITFTPTETPWLQTNGVWVYSYPVKASITNGLLYPPIWLEAGQYNIQLGPQSDYGQCNLPDSTGTNALWPYLTNVTSLTNFPVLPGVSGINAGAGISIVNSGSVYTVAATGSASNVPTLTAGANITVTTNGNPTITNYVIASTASGGSSIYVTNISGLSSGLSAATNGSAVTVTATNNPYLSSLTAALGSSAFQATTIFDPSNFITNPETQVDVSTNVFTNGETSVLSINTNLTTSYIVVTAGPSNANAASMALRSPVDGNAIFFNASNGMNGNDAILVDYVHNYGYFGLKVDPSVGAFSQYQFGNTNTSFNQPFTVSNNAAITSNLTSASLNVKGNANVQSNLTVAGATSSTGDGNTFGGAAFQPSAAIAISVISDGTEDIFLASTPNNDNSINIDENCNLTASGGALIATSSPSHFTEGGYRVLLGSLISSNDGYNLTNLQGSKIIGTLTNTVANATNFSGSLAGNVTGTQGATVISVLPAISGASLTSLTAANISAGTAGINISGNAATATSAATSGSATNATYATNSGASGIASNAVTGITLTNAVTTGESATSITIISGSIPATTLTGTIADARLSTNVPLLNATNTYIGTNNFSNTVSMSNLSASTVLALDANKRVISGAAYSGASLGTVTSVTFTGDGTVLSSTPSSAVTAAGTLTATLANATSDSVLGNSTGSPAAPSWQTAPTISGANITTLNASQIASGTVPFAAFPQTGIGTNGNVLTTSGSAVTWVTPSASGGGGPTFAITNLSYASTTNINVNALVNTNKMLMNLAMTNNANLVTPTNGPVMGQVFVYELLEGATGGYSITADSGFVLSRELNAFNIYTNANAVNILTFWYDTNVSKMRFSGNLTYTQ